MPVARVLLRTGLISGALAGLAGAGEVAGLKGYLTQDLSPGFGYTGIVVAMLAQLNPLGVVLAAVFVAGVFVGADSMSRTVGVPATSPTWWWRCPCSPCCWPARHPATIPTLPPWMTGARTHLDILRQAELLGAAALRIADAADLRHLWAS